MVVVMAMLLARQTASRKVSVIGIDVTLELLQALMLSVSPAEFTFNVRLDPEVTSSGVACEEVSTTMSRSELIF
jgi:hypothetical protein